MPPYLTAHRTSSSGALRSNDSADMSGGLPSAWLEPFANTPLSDPRYAASVGLLLSPSGNSFVTTSSRISFHSSERQNEASASSPTSVDPLDAEVALALSTFAIYVPRAQRAAVFSFLHKYVSPLLFHPSPPVRLEAALLTARLLAPQGKSAMPTHGQLGVHASNLLANLVSVVVGDPDEAIRYRVLEELDSRFLLALSDPALLRPLGSAARCLARRPGGRDHARRPLAEYNLRWSTRCCARCCSLPRAAALIDRRDALRSRAPSHQEAAMLLTAVERRAPRLVRTYCLQILHRCSRCFGRTLRRTPPPRLRIPCGVLSIAGPLLDPYGNDLSQSLSPP